MSGGFLSNPVAATEAFVADPVSSVNKALDNVGSAVQNTVTNIVNNPLPTIEDIAAVATGNPELVPVINAGNAIASGANPGNVLGSTVAGIVGACIAPCLGISKGLGSTIGSTTANIVNGANPTNAIINAGVNYGVNQGINNLINGPSDSNPSVGCTTCQYTSSTGQDLTSPLGSSATASTGALPTTTSDVNPNYVVPPLLQGALASADTGTTTDVGTPTGLPPAPPLSPIAGGTKDYSFNANGSVDYGYMDANGIYHVDTLSADQYTISPDGTLTPITPGGTSDTTTATANTAPFQEEVIANNSSPSGYVNQLNQPVNADGSTYTPSAPLSPTDSTTQPTSVTSVTAPSASTVVAPPLSLPGTASPVVSTVTGNGSSSSPLNTPSVVDSSGTSSGTSDGTSSGSGSGLGDGSGSGALSGPGIAVTTPTDTTTPTNTTTSTGTPITIPVSLPTSGPLSTPTDTSTGTPSGQPTGTPTTTPSTSTTASIPIKLVTSAMNQPASSGTSGGSGSSGGSGGSGSTTNIYNQGTASPLSGTTISTGNEVNGSLLKALNANNEVISLPHTQLNDFYGANPYMLGTSNNPYAYGVLPSSSAFENVPSIEGLKEGGSTHKHKPEFVTGITGHYAQGRGTGQSDDIPALLKDGDYVMDADIVAALGDGSSKAGAEALHHFMNQFPHKQFEHLSTGGHINAMIADGEFVFPASLVTALGGGSNKEGAKKLDEMREKIREHKRSASTKNIPPKAKSPLSYMEGK